MADLDTLEEWVGPLLLRIGPAERTKLARTIAQQLRRSQQQRVAAQRNPDGSPYAPRKQRKLRSKLGRIRQKVKMFQKIRASAHLKASGSANDATIGFRGRTERIARIHQYGLRDRPFGKAPAASYAKREILGLTEEEKSLITDMLLTHLTQ